MNILIVEDESRIAKRIERMTRDILFLPIKIRQLLLLNMEF